MVLTLLNVLGGAVDQFTAALEHFGGFVGQLPASFEQFFSTLQHVFAGAGQGRAAFLGLLGNLASGSAPEAGAYKSATDAPMATPATNHRIPEPLLSSAM
jgi:hypothetical protein